MTTHTPGPWAIFRDHPDAETRESMATIDSTDRTEYTGDEIATVYLAPAGSQGEANARLISAAPDLLEALLAVVSVADRKTTEFDLAHAAIAKATGA